MVWLWQKVPFSITDLNNWKIAARSYRDDPDRMASALETMKFEGSYLSCRGQMLEISQNCWIQLGWFIEIWNSRKRNGRLD